MTKKPSLASLLMVAGGLAVISAGAPAAADVPCGPTGVSLSSSNYSAAERAKEREERRARKEAKREAKRLAKAQACAAKACAAAACSASACSAAACG
ncbi:MAG: hypothetical protein AAFR88_08720, partial [Pseudomonadota bacterium]